MATIAEHQVAASAPPRRGAVIALEVDSTARAYDISTLILGDTVAPDVDRRQEVVLWMQAETNDVFFHFHSSSATDLDEAAKITAGSAMAFANTYGGLLEAGNAPVKIRINRQLDKYLVVIAASTAGILRFWAASEAF